MTHNFRSALGETHSVIYQPHSAPKTRRHQAVRRSHAEFGTGEHRGEHHWHERPLPTPFFRRVLLSCGRAVDQLRYTLGERLAEQLERIEFARLGKVGLALAALATVPLIAAMQTGPKDAAMMNFSLQLPPAGSKTGADLFAPKTLSKQGDGTSDSSKMYLPGVNDEQWQVETLRRDETVGALFDRLGLSAADVHRVVNFSEQTKRLARVFPGQQLAFRIQGGKLAGLQFESDESTRILLSVDGEKLSQELLLRSMETRINYASASIEHSLFGAATDAEISDALVMRMTEVFNFDIDFAQDLQPGDQFALVHEQIYRDGEKLRDGEILAATFINRGKRYEIYRFINEAGRVDYLSADGLSRKKAFIRTPVAFTRISSKFSPNRHHPVLGTMRRHMGVDYASPTGTPIKATGSATVKIAGWQNGYGNVIYLSHKGGIETVYGHLSRFAKGLSKGDRVSQGDIIGYVGSTGMSTGPHLHYEFRIGGTHRDPLSVDLPIADPLSGSEMARFKSESVPLIARLKQMEMALASGRGDRG